MNGTATPVCVIKEDLEKDTAYCQTNTNMEIKENQPHKEEKLKQEEWIPPNGGYGWVIVGCSFMMLFIFAAYSQLGIFLLELEKSFQVSKTTISWINATHTVTGRILGILIGPFLKQVGSRWVALAGILLISLGYFSSSFVNNIPLLFITFGVMASLGCGCLYTVANSGVQQYFTTKRSIAGGFTLAGISAGTFAWPPLGQTLVQRYGWRITFQIESAIFMAMGMFIIIFLKPPGTNAFCQPCCMKEKDKKADNRTDAPMNCQTCCLTKICDVSLLRNPVLTIFWISMWFMSIGYLANSIYMPVRGELMGFDPSASAWQTSVMGIAGGVATMLFAAVGNIPGVNRMLMSAVGLLLNGIQCFASTFVNSSTLLLVNAGILGFVSGTYSSVPFVIVVDIVGIEQVALAGGIHAAVFGFGHLVLHPTAGALLDATGDPQAPFYLATAAFLLAALFEGVSLFLRNHRKTTFYGMGPNTISETTLRVEDNTGKETDEKYTKDNEMKDTELYIIHF